MLSTAYGGNMKRIGVAFFVVLMIINLVPQMVFAHNHKHNKEIEVENYKMTTNGGAYDADAHFSFDWSMNDDQEQTSFTIELDSKEVALRSPQTFQMVDDETAEEVGTCEVVDAHKIECSVEETQEASGNISLPAVFSAAVQGKDTTYPVGILYNGTFAKTLQVPVAGPSNEDIDKSLVKSLVQSKEDTSIVHHELQVNKGQNILTHAQLVDVPDAALTYTLGSLKIYDATIASDGVTVQKGQETTFPYTIEAKGNGFVISFEDTIDRMFIVTYDTNITDIKKKTYTSTSKLTSDEKGTIEVTKTVKNSVKQNVKPAVFVVTVEDKETHKALEGARVQIADAQGNIVQTLVTGKDGKAYSKKLPQAVYTVKQSETNEGYVNDVAIYTIDALKGGTFEKTIQNIKIKEDVRIVAKDKKTNKILSGATFELQTASGEVVSTKTTGADGSATFDDVVYGTYKVVETKAPKGYLLNSDAYPVQITEGTTFNVTFWNQKITTLVEVYAKDQKDQKGTEGATFELRNKKGKVISKGVTGKNGKAQLKNVPYGTYTLVETGAPKGYEKNTTKVKVVVKSTKKITKEFKHEKIQSEVKVKLVEKGTTTALTEGTFELRNGKDEVVATGTLNEKGELVFEHVFYGTYTLVQTKAPKEYVVNTTPVAVSITTKTPVSVTIENEKIHSKVIVHLVDDQTKKGVEGATYELVDAKGKVIETKTTQANGMLVFSDVVYGTYTVRETLPATGYIASSQKHTVEINNTEAVTLDLKSKRITSKVTILKKDELLGYPLSGANFELRDASGNVVQKGVTTYRGLLVLNKVPYGTYTLVETKAPVGYARSEKTYTISVTSQKEQTVVIKNRKIEANVIVTKTDGQTKKGVEGAVYELRDGKGRVVDIEKTTSTGQATFEKVPYGSYSVRESEAAKGYIKNEEVKKFVVESSDPLYIDFSGKMITSDITIIKKDVLTAQPLKGATFELRSKDGKVVQSGISNEMGIVSFNDVQYGIYTLVETKAPIGYSVNNGTTTISVENLKPITQVVTNKQIKADVIVTKADGETNEPLSGATFELRTKEGKLISKETTNSKGIATFTDVVYGDYELVESGAPKGYIRSTTSRSFSVVAPKPIQITINNKVIRGNVVITNRDGETRELLPSATFELRNSEGKVVAYGKASSRGLLTFENIIYGTYSLVQVDPPKDYLHTQNDKKIVLTEKGDLLVEVSNTKNMSMITVPELPETGVMTLAVASGGLGVAEVLRRKQLLRYGA